MNKFNKKMFILFVIALLPSFFLNLIIKSEKIINVFEIISLNVFLVILIGRNKKIKYNNSSVIMLVMILYQILVSLINQTITIGILYGYLFLLITTFLLQNQLNEKKYEFIYALLFLNVIRMIINLPVLLTQINVPEYNKILLIGSKNSILFFAIPTIYYSYLIYYLNQNKLSKNIFNFATLLAILSTFLSGSSTGTIIICLMILFLFLGNKIRISLKTYLVIYLIGIFVIFNTSIITEIPILYDIIVNKMNKDLTFTGRTNIWNIAIENISKNFWGYGKGNSIIYSNNNYNLDECHNLNLQFLLDGGVPLLIMFYLYIISNLKINVKCLAKEQDEFRRFAVMIIFIFLISGFTESISYNINLWWIIAITGQIILNNMEEEKNE